LRGWQLYAHVYPNLMINRYGPWLDVNYAIPLAADRCEVVFEYFLDEATAREHEHKPGGLQA
jgi:choline monooxygenase